MRRHFDESGDEWRLPWAIPPEVDSLAATRLREKVPRAFIEDVT
ncbi:MAG: hypothetical protein ACOZQL_12070 [Myxococcota bacterium]